MKVITQANTGLMTFAFHIVFIWTPVNFRWAQARVRPGVATSLRLDDTPRGQLVVTPEVHDIHVVETRVHQLVER